MFIKESFLHYQYYVLLIYLIIAVVLSIIILVASYFFAIQNPETEKLSTYECGFEPYGDARNLFDVKFYLIAIFFIVFDIETMFLYPWCLAVSKSTLLNYWSMIDFILELSVGLFYIWYIGALEWEE